MSTQSDGNHREFDTLVIGGGVSGLAVANAIARKGKHVHVVENSPRLGGSVQSEIRDGFLCEAGPNSMLVKSQAVWDYIEELGLAEDRVEANEISNKRFLVKNGRMAALPQSPLSAVTTPLYSITEKFRLLAEPFIGKSKLEDESVTSFVSRRMGPAFLEYGISALVSGIFAGNPDALSLKHAFPKVWNLEQNYGSLIGGALKMKRERKKKGIVPFKSRMISFKSGLQQLVDALCKEENLTCSTDTTVTSIQQNEAGHWTIQTELAGQTMILQAKQLILATPLDAYKKLPLPAECHALLETAPEIDYPPLSTLVLGFKREDIGHPLDGFGVLCPRMEKRFGLGCIFSSTLFPGRAPDGMVSLMCFIGGVQQPANGELPTDELIEATIKDLRPLLDIKGDPVFSSHNFWPRAIPQYNVGHGFFITALEEIEKNIPGIHFHGNFRGGPGLNDCIENSLNLADSLT